MTTTERIQVLKKAIEALTQDYFDALNTRGGGYNREFDCSQRAVSIRDEIDGLNWDLSQLQKRKRFEFISDMRDALDALEAGILNDHTIEAFKDMRPVPTPPATA